MKKNTSKSVAVKATSNHATNSVPKSLTTEEKDKFQELENQISENMLSSFKLAAALAQIREEKLYRAEFGTFEEYCKKRWEYSRSYCERLAKMNSVLTDLKEYKGEKQYPRNELQARVYAPLNKDQRITLIKKVVAESESDGTTAAELTKHRKQLWPGERDAESKPAKSKVTIIDVDASDEVAPSIPSIIKLTESAKDVLKGLEESDSADNEFGEHLREFIKLIEPVVKWEKAKNN